VFLTPDLKPFTGGTYFPPDDRYGRPGFRRILLMLANAWRTRRNEVDQAAAEITQHLQGMGQLQLEGGELSPDLLRGAVRVLGQSFDSVNGGFGSAPKFPHPMDLRVLLRAWKRFGDEDALHMVRHTLERMAMGGIYDHLGGGFARYSTDAHWLVPHFEKMLYDNALLTVCYLEAYQATGDPLYREVVEETLGWVKREMTSPEGPFYSTLDADSEGVEGKFYVWTEEEVEQVLGKGDAQLFGAVYGVQPGGNWNDPHGHGPARANILHRTRTFAEYARQLNMAEPALRDFLAGARSKLFEVRSRRVPPGKDDKALTAWNGLMITAHATAAQVLDSPQYAATAARAADFILTRMRAADGKLLRTWSAGSPAKLNAYLEDYAYLLEGLLALYEATFEPRWVESALQLAEVMIEQFWDPHGGGFFFTGRDHETLIARGKDPHDNATPSGNAVAVTALLRLVKLTGRPDFWDRAETTLQLYQGLLASHPNAAGQMLIALDFYLGPVQELAIVGDPAAEDTRRVLRTIRQGFRPNRVVALQPVGGEGRPDLIPLLADKPAHHGTVTTYVCEDFSCQAPLVGAEAAETALKP
jgi:uncharacterized protein YyaL (SSP411 family)